MSKKSKIAIKLNEDLVAIDEELDVAMDGLDNVNTRIVGMLTDIEDGTFDSVQDEEGEGSEASAEGVDKGSVATEEVPAEAEAEVATDGEAEDEFDGEDDEFDDDDDEEDDD